MHGSPAARVANQALAALLATTAFGLAAEGVVNVNLMPYAGAVGVPAFWLGVVYVTHRLVRIAAAPLVGVATDRFGRRPLALLGVAMAAVSFLGLGLTQSTAGLVVARAGYGLGYAFLSTAGMASVLDLSAGRGTGGALGLYQAALYGVYPLGRAAGGFLADWLGYSTAFVLCGAATFAAAALGVFTVRETRGGTPDRSLDPSFGLADYPRLVRGPVGA